MKALLARIPAIYFILIGACLMAAGWIPIIRKILPFDQQTSLPLVETTITIVMFWIAGLMAGLTGMIQFAKKETNLTIKNKHKINNENKIACLCHLSGLLFYTGIPFANFFVCFLLWQAYRQRSMFINQQGIETVNFQISHALYLLLSLFLVFAFGFGIIMVSILSIFHIILTIAAAIATLNNKPFNYPANIKIISFVK